MVVSTSQFRNGLKIELEGEPFVIVEFQHIKPGKGGAFVRTKLKSLKSGSVLQKTFTAGDRVDTPNLEEREMQYLYRSDDGYCFMDTSSFEQLFLTEAQVGEARSFLQENVTATVLFHNDAAVGVTLPIFVQIPIVQTEPGVRGDTASGGTKPAKLATGAVVQVPFFLDVGDVIKVDTRTGEYVERVK